MVDLQGQYERIKNEVQTSFEEVLSTTAFINGPQVQAFQKNWKTIWAWSTSSLAPMVLMPSKSQWWGSDSKKVMKLSLLIFTFAATVEVIALLKLTPVLVDVYDDTFNIDIEAIEKAITPRTKAIVPVHLFGQPANMEAVMALAKKHNLFVIEDNAQAIGADYTFADGRKQKSRHYRSRRGNFFLPF